MSDDLVEKVARAICCPDGVCICDDPVRNPPPAASCGAGAHRVEARAALRVVREALAEPDEAMQQAGDIGLSFAIELGWTSDAALLRTLAADRDNECLRADTNAEAHTAAVNLTRLLEADCDALRAENARLREALIGIERECCDGICDGTAVVNWERTARRAAGRAKDALKEPRHD